MNIDDKIREYMETADLERKALKEARLHHTANVEAGDENEALLENILGDRLEKSADYNKHTLKHLRESRDNRTALLDNLSNDQIMKAIEEPNLLFGPSTQRPVRPGLTPAASGSGGTFVIAATSSASNTGNLASISINDVKVGCKKNESGHDRGLHIVVANESTGAVEAGEVFDTHKSSIALEQFISQNPLPMGFIVVAAC